MVTDNINSKINYFIPGPQQEADERENIEITQFHREFNNTFTGIECLNGTSSLQDETGWQTKITPQTFS